MIQVVWFKRDLRTIDHRPLAEAARAGPVLPLYVVEPAYWRLPDTSARQWVAVRSALVELSARLAMLGAPLIVRTGSVVEVLAKIHAVARISRVLAHEETGNLWTYQRDTEVHALCRRLEIPLREYSQTGVIRGARARDRWASHYERFVGEPLVAEPLRLASVPTARIAAIPSADALGLGDDGCADPQSGTRQSGLALIESFLAGRGADYRRGMSSPLLAEHCCSRLSVALATGALSVREVLQRIHGARQELASLPPTQRPLPDGALRSLVSRLFWRGHFMQKLDSEPELEQRAFHPLHEQARAPTASDSPTLAAWATGRTGYPFFDACMRSLIVTGWLNFRMRAMLQSFASYQLALDWRGTGERLARLFTDYEPGIHWPQVQMQSGQTGINVPRMYNPIKQGLDQDPEGHFTRRWVPELAQVPLEVLQTPWLAGITARSGYPAPLVDHATAVREARARLTAVRQTAGYREAALAVLHKHGSRGRRLEQGRRPARARVTAKPQDPDQMSLFGAGEVAAPMDGTPGLTGRTGRLRSTSR
jgi:deoxyribodipyrimidine photo-lyase